MREPIDDGWLYFAPKAFMFGDKIIHEGMVIFGSTHPYRVGREASWFPLTILYEVPDGMTETTATAFVGIEGTAPTDRVTDDAPTSDGQFWAFITVRVRTPNPWQGDVYAPEDHKPAALNARGENPFFSNADPHVASLFSRRRKQDAQIQQDIESAAEFEPSRSEFSRDFNGDLHKG